MLVAQLQTLDHTTTMVTTVPRTARGPHHAMPGTALARGASAASPMVGICITVTERMMTCTMKGSRAVRALIRPSGDDGPYSVTSPPSCLLSPTGALPRLQGGQQQGARVPLSIRLRATRWTAALPLLLTRLIALAAASVVRLGV